MFDEIKNALTFTKGERVAVIILAAMIFILIAANFFVTRHKHNVNKSSHDLDSIMALHENAINELRDRKMAEQIEREARYQKSKEEREKREREYRQRAEKPKFKKESKKTDNHIVKKEIPIIEINSSDTIILLELPEIGPFFAKNIVEYRDKLGGYIEKGQLLEVYGFDSTRLSIISPFITIDSTEIVRIRVNHDDFRTILRHPYIEYDDVKKIVNYRESKGFIKDWNTYKTVVGRDIDKRLELYLEFQ